MDMNEKRLLIMEKHSAAVAYYRYSSDKQTEDSIEAQRRACEAYADAHGYVIISEYVDEAISGKGDKTSSRVQYQRMLRDCGKGLFKTVLIHKYDRVARNLGEHVNLEKKLHDSGVTLIATAQDFGTSNESKIMKTLMWALSEYYIDNLADEVKKGLKETALKGLHTGGVALFGYDVVDQRYVVNDLEAVFVRKLFDAAANREGFTTIINEMAAAGITGKRGKPIKYTQIYEMLRNEKYTGTYAYSTKEERTRADRRTKPNAIRIENALPIIISKAQFEEVQRIMNERKQVGNKAGYLCSGLVYCICGAKMHGSTPERKGHTYRKYSCSAKCGFGTVQMDDIDAAAAAYLKALLSPVNQKKISQALRKYQSGESGRVKDFNAVIKKKVDSKQEEYNALMNNLATGTLPPEVVADIGKRMMSLKDEMDALRETEPPKDYTAGQIEAWLGSLLNTPDEKAVHLLIERIDIITKTDFNITSTLKSVLGETGCGGEI